MINWTHEPSQIATQPFPDFKNVVGTPPVVADARHSGMRIVRVSEKGFTHRWYELSNVPATFDDAFTSKARWSSVKERYVELADVMGLHAAQKLSAARRRRSIHPQSTQPHTNHTHRAHEVILCCHSQP